MAALTAVTASRAAGGDLRAGAMSAAGVSGDTFSPGDDVWLRVKNGNAGACTVTVTPSTAGGPRGTTISAYALAPAVELTSGDRLYGPFPASPFADVSDGLVHVSYSVTSSVTVEVLKLANN
jgi:thiamine monophosphate kinase